jgi:uncharacterized protein YdaT
VIENPSANSDVVAMDVGLGVFDVQGSVGEGMGPVVERDAEVWARADVGEDDDDMDEDEDEDEDGADEENGEGKGEGEGEEKEKKDQEETSSTPTRKVVEI